MRIFAFEKIALFFPLSFPLGNGHGPYRLVSYLTSRRVSGQTRKIMTFRAVSPIAGTPYRRVAVSKRRIGGSQLVLVQFFGVNSTLRPGDQVTFEQLSLMSLYPLSVDSVTLVLGAFATWFIIWLGGCNTRVMYATANFWRMFWWYSERL